MNTNKILEILEDSFMALQGAYANLSDQTTPQMKEYIINNMEKLNVLIKKLEK